MDGHEIPIIDPGIDIFVARVHDTADPEPLTHAQAAVKGFPAWSMRALLTPLGTVVQITYDIEVRGQKGTRKVNISYDESPTETARLLTIGLRSINLIP